MPRGVYERKKEEVIPVVKPVAVIPETPKVSGCNNCGHEKEKHYGSKNLWCNTAGCLCKALK